jgi:type I restriction enzyme M protein
MGANYFYEFSDFPNTYIVAKEKTGKTIDTEIDSYAFIKSDLKQLGWDTSNPGRSATGQVYTQAECRQHSEIKDFLGSSTPENIVLVRDSVLWVIEAKRSHRQLEQAIREAIEYAHALNKSKSIKALFVSGVAGNATDGYLVVTRFLQGKEFVPITINGKEVSALVTPEIARLVLESGTTIKDIPIDEPLFFSKAEKINSILHLGAINKSQRARVIAALLLSMVDDTPPNIDATPIVLIREINARVESVLTEQGKENFYDYIRLQLPPSSDNHIKFKKALVQTLQELRNLNIRSAMNSGTDVLGKFYEVFLKYGNGAKEIGIVLTPRHITSFIADVINVTHSDFIYDPTCGTGGFLVASFDHIKQSSTEEQVNRFKVNNLFGVEQEAEVVALAIVNMIFRADGKSNIIEGDCFQKNIISATIKGVPTARYSSTPSVKDEERIITKVMMNPPFALKKSDEKEFKFIEQALKQMRDGEILFSVLPYSAMVRPSIYQTWRKESLLRNNTLLSVVTFPAELFYPVGVRTVGIFVRKGNPHPKDQNVLWIRALNDGMLKSKGKRLLHPKATNDFPLIHDLIKAFLVNPKMKVSNIEMFQKACPIDYDDPLLELVPENYLDQSPPSKEELKSGIDKVLRESVAFMIQENKESEYVA